MQLDDRILAVLSDMESRGEWEIAMRLYPWDDSNRSKHGAWTRVIVLALRRLYDKGLVGCFWVSHGSGVPGDRIWFRRTEPPLPGRDAAGGVNANLEAQR